MDYKEGMAALDTHRALWLCFFVKWWNDAPIGVNSWKHKQTLIYFQRPQRSLCLQSSRGCNGSSHCVPYFTRLTGLVTCYHDVEYQNNKLLLNWEEIHFPFGFERSKFHTQVHPSPSFTLAQSQLMNQKVRFRVQDEFSLHLFIFFNFYYYQVKRHFEALGFLKVA